MISDFAIEEIEALQAEGIALAPGDIVRLNALGLKLEAAQGKHALDCTYLLPRVAAISSSLWFRQPTVGHEIWLETVERYIEPGDFQSLLAIYAFALSRAPDALPDPLEPTAVETAVSAFARDCAPYTRDQIFAAVKYVRYGADSTVGETSGASRSCATDTDADAQERVPPEPDPDWTECIAVGVLNEGRAVLWGISEAEMRRMGIHELNAVIERARKFHGLQQHPQINHWLHKFYDAIEEIRARSKPCQKST